MRLDIMPIVFKEIDYLYTQSTEIDKKSGCIGHLRGDFAKSGDEFHTTWFDHESSLKTDEFNADFDDVINKLRAEGMPLSGLSAMEAYCGKYPGSRISSTQNNYGFRVRTDKHCYFIRCTPQAGDYNFYVYAYRTAVLYPDKIRFINTHYNELFRIPDSGSIVVTRPEGEEYIGDCKFLDETHTEINGECYHICQFAEIQERNGATVKPETMPEINRGYRIIQRNTVGDKVFKLGVNPDAVQRFVTWQSYTDNPTCYDWGHYWNDRSTASTDLFQRTDGERRGVSYDHTKLIDRKKNKDAR
jgi:hypothetical protein